MGNSFGPNVGGFLKGALPPNDTRHALTIGEFHSYTDFRKTISGGFPTFRAEDRHNVTTLGLEAITSFNVPIWAAQERTARVSPGQEAAYLERLLYATSMPIHRKKALIEAENIATAIREGIEVVAYDPRFLKNHKDSTINQAIRIINLDQETKDKLRVSSIKDLDARAQQIARDKELPLISSNMQPADMALVAWYYSEIQDLMKINPSYAARLEALENVALQAAAKKLGEDAQAAAILTAYAKLGNLITIGGSGHIDGTSDGESGVQGTLADHLNRNGWKTTPVIIGTQSELSDLLRTTSRGTEIHRQYAVECAARAPMHLLVPDHDIVLDVSSQEILRSVGGVETPANLGLEKAKNVANFMLKIGAKLTCDNPTLPTSAECAKQEAESGKACLPSRR